MRKLPGGVLTFVFTDIEGSTRLLQGLGAERYAERLHEHRRRVRAVVVRHGGIELGTEGDAFFLVFEATRSALAAARDIQAALGDGPIRVRMGLHTGTPLLVDDDYVGLDVHKAARICSAAHGGQVLVSEATHNAARGFDLRDLGYHRLKDLTAPERLFQLGADDFPPPRTLRRGNLPVQPTPLIGRERELAELLDLARGHRLVTLTGPGGTGKTRLALAAAAELADERPDGAWWVPLAAVRDPALVIPTVAQAIGASGELAEHLRDKRLLLVLDNLEQVLDAAAELGALLAGAPGLGVIATSRERLALGEEQEYVVSQLTAGAAAELFVSRARQVKPDFAPDQTVGEICRRLDSLPLALELASTRVKLLSTTEILRRLDHRLEILSATRRDLPARQTTMRAAIDWSYDLLAEHEQQMFRRLAAFAGSFALDAAEAVTGAGLDDLQSLLDKSLVRATEHHRFFLLETTHEYAAERLAEAGETDEAARRHAEWYLALATTARGELQGAGQREWVERLHGENDNLRSVLAWTLEHDRARGIELADALFRTWHMRGQLPELIRWYERALEDRTGLEPARLSMALQSYGAALMYTEDQDGAERTLEDALALARAAGDAPGEAGALNQLGSVASGRGDFERALKLQTQGLEIYRRLSDAGGVGRSLHLVGEDLCFLGDLDRARETLQEAVAIKLDRADRHAAMASLHSLGDLELDAGKPRHAEGRYREALEICLELEDERSQAYCLAGLAAAASLREEIKTAGCLWAAAEAIEQRLGLRMLSKERARYERRLVPLTGDSRFEAGRASAESFRPEQLFT